MKSNNKATRFIVNCNFGNVIGANYDEVISTLSEYPELLRIFSMHVWNPGRFMRYPLGVIVCVSNEVL